MQPHRGAPKGKAQEARALPWHLPSTRFSGFHLLNYVIWIFAECLRKFVAMWEDPGADPGFLPGEGAKGMMTLYGMGMSDFLHTQTHICNFSKMFLAILCLNGVKQPFKRHQCPFFLPLRRGNPRLRRGSFRPRGGRPPQRPPPWIRA